MPLLATWLGRESVERIADLRLRCYGGGPAERAAFLKKTEYDRALDGDVLVISDDTGDVATATSLSLTNNQHGTPLPCQGVAWVGTVRSHRRRRVDGRGLASRVMDALADRARDRGEVVSMLAPFRVSFYEAFGFGVVERQNIWTIPLGLLPEHDTAGFAEYRDSDFAAALAGRQRQFDQTHGDVATTADGLKCWLALMNDIGFRLVDRQGDAVSSQFTLGTEMEGERRIAVVHRGFWDSPAALQRMLSMLGTLRDQYSAVRITLPTDLPVNWWLRERQVPHRAVDHPAPTCRLITRMQGRVVDVPATLAAARPGGSVRGACTVAVKSRAGVANWRLEVDGRVTATPANGPAGIAMDDATWAAIVFGDLPPATALKLGLLTADAIADVDLLAAAVAGPVPYCHEYF